MPPNSGNFLYKEAVETIKPTKNVYEEIRPKNEPRYLLKIREIEKKMGFVTPLKWKNVIFLVLSHIIILTWFGYNLSRGIYFKWQTLLFKYTIWRLRPVYYGAYTLGQQPTKDTASCSYAMKMTEIQHSLAVGLFVFGYPYLGAFGVTAGVHRYWSHRSYKATTPFRWLLGILFTVAAQNKLYDWIRDHCVHHKFSDTSADPHNASRGFFFSHIGWLMMMKHPDVIREGRKIDLSDIDKDLVIQFNSKYYIQLQLILCIVVPMAIPPLLWGESWSVAALSQLLGLLQTMHWIWCVNSVAHFSGHRPYNPNIKPAQSWLLSFMTIGEGWHNYHHTFPWDYKAAELPYFLNITTLLLDCAAGLGWVSHRKTASPEIIQATVKRTHNT